MTTAALPVAPAAAVSRTLRFPLGRQLYWRNRTALRQRIVDALEDGYRDIVLDASECGYIDSNGLGVLVSCSKRCRDVGGSLTLDGVHGDVRTLFALTKLDTVIDLVARDG